MRILVDGNYFSSRGGGGRGAGTRGRSNIGRQAFKLTRDPRALTSPIEGLNRLDATAVNESPALQKYILLYTEHIKVYTMYMY